MSELTTSGPYSPDGFEDSFSLSARWHNYRDRQRAVRDVAELSDVRAQAHDAANLFRDFHVTPAENDPSHELRRELQGTHTLLGRWALMATYEAFRTVDLARVKNKGDWDATAHTEQEMQALAQQLYQQNELDDVIPRNSPEAKRRIMIDPTIVAGNGLVLVRRKRLMLATRTVSHVFSDMRPVNGYGSDHPASGRIFSAQTRLEVDKVSEFVLDVRRMRRADSRAAAEVLSVIRSDSPQEVTRPEDEAVLQTPGVIEAAIDGRDDMLIPVTTTYYADRKYRDIQELYGDQAA